MKDTPNGGFILVEHPFVNFQKVPPASFSLFCCVSRTRFGALWQYRIGGNLLSGNIEHISRIPVTDTAPTFLPPPIPPSHLPFYASLITRLPCQLLQGVKILNVSDVTIFNTLPSDKMSKKNQKLVDIWFGLPHGSQSTF